MNKLKYEKYRTANNIIIIDLHNGFSVVAVSTPDVNTNNFITTLFLKENTIDRLELIEKAEHMEFSANKFTISSAILKQVSKMLEDNFFEYYINRFQNYRICIDENIDNISKLDGDKNVS